MLNRVLFIILVIISSQKLLGQSDCEIVDSVITEFPFFHSNTLQETDGDDWNFENEGYNDSSDYAYEITVTEVKNFYMDTCDTLTNFDTILSIKDACGADTSLNHPCGGSGEIQDNEYCESDDGDQNFCQESGIPPPNQNYASIIDSVRLEPGTYYVIVDGYAGATGDYALAIGTLPEIISSEIAEDDSYIEIHFSEGMYTEATGEGALQLPDFTLEFDSNGGTASNATANSLTNNLGQPLVGGEDTVRVAIDVSGASTGEERITIRAATDASLFNSFGMSLLRSYSQVQNLSDFNSPVLESTVPENSSINVPTNSTIILQFSEAIQNSDGNDITNQNAQNSITVTDLSSDTVLDFSITPSNNNRTFTIEPDTLFTEYINIRVRLTNIQDVNNNPFSTVIFQFQTADETSPTIAASSLASSNAYATINFNEPVYSTNEGSGAITLDDIGYDFQENGSLSCFGIITTNITNYAGSALSGGEEEIRVYFSINGAPEGIEGILFSPFNGVSIYDAAGNPMPDTTITDALILNAAPRIVNVTIDSTSLNSNDYIDVVFSSDVYGNLSATLPVYNDDFEFDLNINDGEATDIDIDEITNTNNEPLDSGEDTIRIHLIITPSPTGVEEITISPAADFRIFNLGGVAVPQTASYGPVMLKDQRGPEAEISMENNALNIDQSSPFTITFDEEINTSEESFLDVCVAASQLKRDDVNGVDHPFSFLLSENPWILTLQLDNGEELESEGIYYFSMEKEFLDTLDNGRDITFERTFTIRDHQKPGLAIADNGNHQVYFENSFINIFFNEEVYGDADASQPLNINYFDLETVSEDGNEFCSIVTVTDTNSNLLSGGEDAVRVNLIYNFTPSGSESIILKISSGSAIFDDSGNKMDEVILDPYILSDELIPAISVTSIENQSLIDLRRSTSINYTFSEIIDYSTIDLSITSENIGKYPSDTIPNDTIINFQNNTLTITLGNDESNLMSYDEIYIQFNSFTDLTGLVSAPHSFTYRTPMLGDYNLNDSIDYKDLDTLREAFINQNEAYELGPYTGIAPHYIIDPDSEFDLDDGIVFVQMWSWYQENFQEIIDDSESLGRPLDLIHQGNTVLIIMDTLSLAGQFQFSYRPGSFPVEINHEPITSNKLFVKSHHTEKGFSALAFSKSKENNNDTIEFIIPNDFSDIGLFYEISDGNSSILQKGIMNIELELMPQDFVFYPAFPNPFNPSTTISFDIPDRRIDESVYLNIYDLRGRLVETLINGTNLPGNYTVHWDASNSSSGIYFLRLISGKYIKTQKIIYLK